MTFSYLTTTLAILSCISCAAFYWSYQALREARKKLHEAAQKAIKRQVFFELMQASMQELIDAEKEQVERVRVIARENYEDLRALRAAVARAST